jgi:hypothetical protein
MQFSGPAQRLLERRAAEISAGKGEARRPGDCAALPGGLMPVAC